jgi:hypothetical protein
VAERYQPARLVRPYAITGGRSGTDLPLIELEALVCSTPQGQQMRSELRWEDARIVDMATAPLAVIELSAKLDLAVGVVRVLLSDLSDKGAIEITTPLTAEDQDMDSAAYTDLLNRVLDGIRSL